MSRKSTILTVSSVFVLGLVVLAVLNFYHVSPTTAATPPCVSHLEQIDIAKNQWALENHKTTNDVPTWNDLRLYFPSWMSLSNGSPVCPEGGTYTLGRVGVPPTCSIGGYRH